VTKYVNPQDHTDTDTKTDITVKVHSRLLLSFIMPRSVNTHPQSHVLKTNSPTDNKRCNVTTIILTTTTRTTTTTTTVLRPFVRDYQGDPVPEETLTHPPS